MDIAQQNVKGSTMGLEAVLDLKEKMNKQYPFSRLGHAHEDEISSLETWLSWWKVCGFHFSKCWVFLPLLICMSQKMP